METRRDARCLQTQSNISQQLQRAESSAQIRQHKICDHKSIRRPTQSACRPCSIVVTAGPIHANPRAVCVLRLFYAFCWAEFRQTTIIHTMDDDEQSSSHRTTRSAALLNHAHNATTTPTTFYCQFPQVPCTVYVYREYTRLHTCVNSNSVLQLLSLSCRSRAKKRTLCRSCTLATFELHDHGNL